MAASTVRSATIDLLRTLGMTTIFGNPGSTELPMFRDFPKDFRYILGLQESIVLGMADGFAQATRNAGFVNLHSAAGVGHSLGNLFTAFKNQTPLVVTAGQQARAILPYEPFLFAERATEFPRPYVKWAIEPARAEDVPAAIARAYLIAMEPPCGPTFVSIPVDDWDHECDHLVPRRMTARNPGDPDALRDIAVTLAAATSPAIVVGAGVARDDAWDEVIALAERHGAIVWAAPHSARNGFPENHTLFAGFLDPFREAAVAKLAGRDVILALGGPLSVYHAEGAGPHVPEGAKVFLVGDNPTIGSWAPAGDAVVANVKLALRTLLNGLAPAARPAPPPRSLPEVLDGRVLSDAYLMQQINKLRPAGAVIVEEAPSSRGAMQARLPMLERDAFYTCASGGLGHGLPAAVGVALGRPGDKVIAILGDGSAMYAIQGLWSAVQLGTPISFVIVKNGRYEALIGFGRHFGLQETVGTKLPELDFCAIARGQGLDAIRVDAAANLDAALAWSFAADHPTLVEVVVD
ncbi:MAG: benzoylformate decarboxylase [Janthinobacterium lividum]